MTSAASTSERVCALQYAAGRVETCRTECPFWEAGGAVVQPRCMLERMLPAEEWTPRLGGSWLRLRENLERGRRAPPERRLFHLLRAGAGDE